MLNISFLLQVTADEAIFSLTMMLQHKQYSQSTANAYKRKSQKSRGGRGGRSYMLPTGHLHMYTNRNNIGIALSQAYQRLLAFQAHDGSFSYTKWDNRYDNLTTVDINVGVRNVNKNK